MKNQIIALLFVTLTACAGSKDDPPPSGTVAKPQLKPVTTASACVDGTPATTLLGSWKTQYESSILSLYATLTFDGRQVTLTNHCVFPSGKELYSSIRVPYMSSRTEFKTLAEGEHTESKDGDTCSTSIAPRTVSYRFEGSCLVMHDDQDGDLFLTR